MRSLSIFLENIEGGFTVEKNKMFNKYYSGDDNFGCYSGLSKPGPCKGG